MASASCNSYVYSKFMDGKTFIGITTNMSLKQTASTWSRGFAPSGALYYAHGFYERLSQKVGRHKVVALFVLEDYDYEDDDPCENDSYREEEEEYADYYD